MPVRPSVRFEVFKRDGFQCVYCGKRPPDVLLEADHIIPLAEGGGDEIENLTTACQNCNRGKGARPLTSRAPVKDLAAQTEELREREAQLRAYHEVQNEIATRQQDQVSTALSYWLELWNVEEAPNYYLPGRQALARYIDKLGSIEVLGAMEIAADKFHYLNTSPVRYLFGILKRKAGRLDGTIQECPWCKKDVLLKDDEDPSLQWWHGDCLSKYKATQEKGA